MTTPLDLDQLQSFCAIADCGSFTEAARRVNKTQSAVSMQIKRLEERLGHPLLTRDGRSVALTEHGEALYSRARRMLRINAEIMDHFSDGDLKGSIRFGVPDDYAVRLLPVILSSFQRTHPKIVVDVRCQPSEELLEGMKKGKYDLVVFTQGTNHEYGELFRTERMFWVASHGGQALSTDPLPIAGGLHCCWKENAVEVLNRIGRDYRVAYTSVERHGDRLGGADRPGGRLPAGKRAAAGHAGDCRGPRPAAAARCGDRHHAGEPRLWRHLRCAGEPHRGVDGQSRRARRAADGG